MTSKIIPFPGPHFGSIEPSEVLQDAMDADLEDVLIIGKTKSGQEYQASSIADGGTILWRIARFKQKLIGHAFVEGE